MPRIGVARLWFAANSHTPGPPTTLAAFRAREWATGRAALEEHRGTATELGGVCEFLEHRNGFQAEVFRCAAAAPGAPMTDEALDEWLADVEAGLRREEPDALYLSLHGAAMSANDREADLTIVRRLRAAMGPERPVVASLDARANLSPQVVALLDGACAARAHPATDAPRAARRALRLMERALAGRRAEGSLAKLPSALTSAAALSAPWAEAAELERRPGILDVSPLAGFAWAADAPSVGAGALVWAEEHGTAREAARGLARRIARPAAPPARLAPEEALRRAPREGATLLLEAADDPMSGGACDAPGLLRALVEAGSALGEAALLYMHDPDAVAAARAAGVGGPLDRPLGARLTRRDGAPVPFAGTVERLTPGRLLKEGREGRGVPLDYGNTAVLRRGPLRVVVTSRRPDGATDPAFLGLHGIAPQGLRVLAIKAEAPPDGWTFAAVHACATPGPAG